MMTPKWHLFASILVTISLPFISVHTFFHEDPLANYNLEASGYDSDAEPASYFSSSEEGEFEIPIGHETGVSKLKGFNEVRRLLAAVQTVSVDKYGAKGDGNDDTQAFEKAWKAACSATGSVNLLVPKRSYLVKPITFLGPCKGVITMQISGTIEASQSRGDYKDGSHWLLFENVQNFEVGGGGAINGNGKTWWANSCKINKALPCKSAPTALTFYKCKGITVKNLKIQNAQQIHISFENSANVQVSNLAVTAPESSPNTDGIHVTNTQNIQISSCTIGTGDDCISIVSGSQKVRATGITCGPGHGISVGSLGSGNSEAYVSDVIVNGAKLSGTSNGVRIKTWQNLEMNGVTYPIIIDQKYCDQDEPCEEQKSAVQVKNVLYQNIKGTSASDVAVKFDCSKSFPCQGIVLQNVHLQRGGGATVKAQCDNVKFSEKGIVSPNCS
ncbi:Polygalacturonase [Bertholletia excelsa]